jgi:hypothetical protein
MNTMHVLNDGYILWNCRIIDNNTLEYRSGGVWIQVIGEAWEVLENEDGSTRIGRKVQNA